MNKIIIWVVVGVVAVGLGVGARFMFGGQNNAGVPGQPVPVVPAVDEASTLPSVTTNGSKICRKEGQTVYLTENFVRKDSMVDNSELHEIHNIPENKIYKWDNQSTRGLIIDLNPAYLENLRSLMVFSSCQPWDFDQSVFTLPANISFQKIRD